MNAGSELVRLLNTVLRNRFLLIVVPVLIGIAVASVILLQPDAYRSEASFIPQTTQQTPQAFSGLAAQFGINLPNDGLDQSPAFYADVLRSREILERVVQAEYASAGGEGGRNLLSVFKVDEADHRANVYVAAERLGRSLRVTTDPETGVVAFSVPAPEPALAREIAEEIISQINTFNLTRRQTVAQSERSFIEERLDGANQDLAGAEHELRQFDERNLRIDNSPALRLERERLERQVGMRQEVVTMLTQAHEQARIDEVRNTPAITVIERPSLPVKRATKGTLQFGLLAVLVSGFLMACFVFGRELYRQIQIGQTPAHREFRALRSSMRPWMRRRRGE